LNMNLLQDALTMLRIADDFSYFAGNDPPKTELRMALQTVITLYPTASGEWSDVIARFDNLRTQKEPPISPEKAEDDLAAWLENLHEDDGELKIQAEAPPIPCLITITLCSFDARGADAQVPYFGNAVGVMKLGG